ncbi:MAG: potassium channel family protein [Pirellulaceae bacterium]
MIASSPIRKILQGMGVCFVTCLLAVVSYHAAGWNWIDSVYMVIITLFGVGYGEVHPITDSVLKLQTMGLIIVGGLSGLFSIGGFIQLVTEGEIRRTLGAHKMSRGLKKMKNHTIICGYGRIGRTLAAELTQHRRPFVIIDTSKSRLSEAEAMGYMVVEGDASQDAVLHEAGITQAKSLATVLPNDAINVFITLTARDLNSSLEIIARAECPSTEHKLRRSGANHVVMPAAIGAVRMAQIIADHPTAKVSATNSHSQHHRLHTIPVSGHAELEEVTLKLAQETLAEVGRIVGIQRADCGIMTELHDDLLLGPEDILLVTQ